MACTVATKKLVPPNRPVTVTREMGGGSKVMEWPQRLRVGLSKRAPPSLDGQRGVQVGKEIMKKNIKEANKSKRKAGSYNQSCLPGTRKDGYILGKINASGHPSKTAPMLKMHTLQP